MKWLKSVGLTLTVVASLMLAPMAVSAQSYGDVLPVVNEIAAGTADDDGQFRFRYTAPDEIDESYLVYVVGTDDDGEPFEWVVAQVSSAFAGLTWTLAGANMMPGSDYVLETRTAGADASVDSTSDDADESDDADDTSDDTADSNSDDNADNADDDETAAAVAGDGDDDNNSRGLVGLALVLFVIGAALVYGIRLTNRRRA